MDITQETNGNIAELDKLTIISFVMQVCAIKENKQTIAHIHEHIEEVNKKVDKILEELNRA